MQHNRPYIYPQASKHTRYAQSSHTPLSAVNYAAYKPSSPFFPASNQSQVYQYNPNPILIDQKQIIIKPRVNQKVPQQRHQTVIHEIVQPKIIEETVVHHERNDREGQKVAYKENPDVNTVDDNKWMVHYNGKKQMPVPPQRSSPEKQRSYCKAPILALLGLLALGGLITAIILGAKKLTQHTIVSQSEHSNGIPQTFQYPQFSITQQTTIIRNNNKNQLQSAKSTNLEFQGIAPIPVTPIPDFPQYSVKAIPITVEPISSAKGISNIQLENIEGNQISQKISEQTGQNYSAEPIAIVPQPLANPLEKQTQIAEPEPTIEPILLVPATIEGDNANKQIVPVPSLSVEDESEPHTLIYSYDPFKAQNLNQKIPQQPGNRKPTTVITNVQPIFAQPIAAHLHINQ